MLTKIDTNLYKNIGIYIGYIKIKKIDDYENIDSVNPLYLMIGKVNGHFEEKNGSKYSVFWFNEIAFYKWKQRNIKKIQITLEWD